MVIADRIDRLRCRRGQDARGQPFPIGIGLALMLVLGAGTSSLGRQDDGLSVRIEGPPPGPHFVGQAIPIRVIVSAGATEPTVEPPEVEGLDVIAGPIEVRPVSASSIGAIVHETNLYRASFLLVPRRPGPLLVPAFRARVDDRSGTSGPIRIEPRQPPAEGRPAWFLGGVGPVEVGLIRRPEAIRLGDSAVVEVRLEGPGALGSTTRPRLRLAEGHGDGAEIVPMPTRSSDEPPSRAFPFRVRPGSAGTTTVQPVLVSWFDPESRTYRTVGSGSVSIRVDDPPEFDPSAVEVASIEVDGERTGLDRGWLDGVLRLVGAAGAAGVLGVMAWRWARYRNRAPGRYARRQANRIEAIAGGRRAELVAESLAGYLRRAIGRPEGALTPPEARDAIEQATGDPELADRVRRLVDSCDASRYSGRSGGGALQGAPDLFRDLARATRPRSSGTTSREDPGRP